MTIQPQGDRFVLKQQKRESLSGLIVEDDSSMRRPIGEIVAVGTGYLAQMARINPGDTVCFNELSGERFVHEKEEFLIVNLSDILAKLMP